MTHTLRDVIHTNREAEFTQMDVVRIVDVHGLGELFVPIRFSYDIGAHKTSECTSRLMGETGPIREGQTYNDHYGFLSSWEDVIDNAKFMAGQFELKPTSKVYSEAIMMIGRWMVIHPPRAVEAGLKFKAHDYLPVPDDWLVDDEKVEGRMRVWNTKDHGEARYAAENRPTPIHEMIPRIEVVIWSSRNTEEENVAALAQLEQYR